MVYPEACDICVKDKINTDLFEGNLQLSVRPFKGANPSVLLVGQDPTLAKRQVLSVLELDNPRSRLYRYIVKDILEPARLILDDVYATDLIKCQFPNNQTPKVIAENHGISIKNFLSPFFHNCRQWFFNEVKEIRPKIILSLGEPVHQLLVEEFAWTVPIRMKNAFGNVYIVNVLGVKSFYVPCIHYNTRGHVYYKNLWKTFIHNLEEAVKKLGIPSCMRRVLGKDLDF